MEPFIKYCIEGDYDSVETYLENGLNPNDVGSMGEVALMHAIASSQVHIVQLLLEHEADPNMETVSPEATPLIEAAVRQNLPIVQLLLSYGADVDVKTESMFIPSHVAAMTGNLYLFMTILGESNDKMKLIEEYDQNGYTALMEAVLGENLQLVLYLCNLGAQINKFSEDLMETPLTLACFKGSEELVDCLVKYGANPNFISDKMRTPLMEAAMEGHYNVTKILLDHGARTNLSSGGYKTALSLACCHGHTNVVALLLKYGADKEGCTDEFYTPLMEASQQGHLDIVMLLMSCGVNINRITNATQETALTLAACGGYYDVVLPLFAIGADLELGGSTPLMEASREGHLRVVRALIKFGACVTAKNAAGETSLHLAAQGGCLDICRLLINAGAEVEAKSNEGLTPLMLSISGGHTTVTDLIMSVKHRWSFSLLFRCS